MTVRVHAPGQVMFRDRVSGNIHCGLMCNPLRVEYDFLEKRGRLWMDDGNCCDMTGCVRFFLTMDQDARLIETYSGTAKDTAYWKQEDGTWQAMGE